MKNQIYKLSTSKRSAPSNIKRFPHFYEEGAILWLTGKIYIFKAKSNYNGFSPATKKEKELYLKYEKLNRL